MPRDEIRWGEGKLVDPKGAREMQERWAARGVFKPERPTTLEIEGRRPTATRVIAGGILAGPIGALAGFAWRKKTKQRIEIRKS